MSIRQLAVLGRRAVVSYNLRIVEGPAVLCNQRYFSGKVLSEEEKAGENIFIKVGHRCAEQIPAFKSSRLRQMAQSSIIGGAMLQLRGMHKYRQ